MPPIPPPTSSGHTTTTDTPLYWCSYERGASARMLVLHGGPGAHHDYLLPQLLRLGELAGGYDLVFYDQRGGGKSRVTSHEPVTWQTQVADMAAVIRELSLEGAVVAGYSWGGLLALLYAAEAARDASLPQPPRLVLLDPAPVTRSFRADFEREFARRQAGADVARLRQELSESGLRERDPDAYRQRNFELGVAGYFRDPADARDLTPFRVTQRVQQSVWESLGVYDLVTDGTLARIDCPAFFVHGRQDPIPLASSEAAARTMGARLAVLEDCGHVPYVEQPEALFAAVDGFLRE